MKAQNSISLCKLIPKINQLTFTMERMLFSMFADKLTEECPVDTHNLNSGLGLEVGRTTSTLPGFLCTGVQDFEFT